jgi:hypothetical protein
MGISAVSFTVNHSAQMPAAFARRQVAHKNRKAWRRSESKRKRERREAEERERQDNIRNEDEAAKAKAQDILSHIGMEYARFLLGALKGKRCFARILPRAA